MERVKGMGLELPPPPPQAVSSHAKQRESPTRWCWFEKRRANSSATFASVGGSRS